MLVPTVCCKLELKQKKNRLAFGPWHLGLFIPPMTGIKLSRKVRIFNISFLSASRFSLIIAYDSCPLRILKQKSNSLIVFPQPPPGVLLKPYHQLPRPSSYISLCDLLSVFVTIFSRVNSPQLSTTLSPKVSQVIVCPHQYSL